MGGYDTLVITDERDLRFGTAPKPLTTRRGMVIGGGRVVYPEINFTLPSIKIDASSMPRIREHYTECITGVLRRAAELEAPGLVVEFETLPPMTQHPEWGLELANIMLEAMEDAHAKTGLKSVFRMTPNDNRVTRFGA